MRRRVFTLASGASLLLFAVTAVFWIASESKNWQDGSVGIAGQVRFASAHGMIALFNQSQPFFDGTIGMSARGSTLPVWPKEVSLRFPGFHFRHFTWPGNFPGGTYWTFGVSFLYPLGVTAILPGAWCVSWLRRGDRYGICSVCSYDLTGNTSGVCPECGAAIVGSVNV